MHPQSNDSPLIKLIKTAIEKMDNNAIIERLEFFILNPKINAKPNNISITNKKYEKKGIHEVGIIPKF